MEGKFSVCFIDSGSRGAIGKTIHSSGLQPPGSLVESAKTRSETEESVSPFGTAKVRRRVPRPRTAAGEGARAPVSASGSGTIHRGSTRTSDRDLITRGGGRR
jgi:hypothetical protein